MNLFKNFFLQKKINEIFLKKFKLAIKYHPDKNQSEHAEEAFKKVSYSKKIIIKI